MLIVDCPEMYMGVVIEKLGPRKGKIKKMVITGPPRAWIRHPNSRVD